MRKATRWGLLGLGFLLVTGVAYQARRRDNALPPPSAQSPGGWKTHDDPMGFSVSVPPGWSVRSDRATGRVELQGAGGETLVVWPVFLAATGGTQPAPSLTPAGASVVIHRLAGKVWPDAEWGPPQPARATAVRLAGRRGDRTVVAVLAWIPSPRGMAGYFYATAAPSARYRNLEDTFARALASFRATGAASQKGSEPEVRYVRWSDPRENAFSLEVPVGWRVTGGAFRFASVDVRPAVEVVSPDGQVRINMGDADLPTFTEPNPTLNMAGFTEGRWYSPGYGVQFMVRRYLPGAVFVSEYVRSKVARGCGELSFTETRDRADATQAINAIYTQYAVAGIAMRLAAGDASFTCRSAGQMFKGYYFAATQLTQTMGSGIWNVQYLFGGLAAADQAPLGQLVLEHMIRTFELNPQWVGMQQNITASTSKIVSRTHQEISDIISSTYRERQSTMDEISRRRSNATLGLEDVVDTARGEQYKVESGANYYWIDQHGTIVGTQTDTRPNLDFRELVRLP